jgi:hypothetical protein
MPYSQVRNEARPSKAPVREKPRAGPQHVRAHRREQRVQGRRVARRCGTGELVEVNVAG